MTNEVQRKILATIARSDGMKYSEAYPGDGIDDDLYNYHLQELVKRGFLIKENKIYSLTNDGKKEITYFNAHGSEQGIFHLIAILILTRNNRKEILVHKRKMHPHRGEISTVLGNVLTGEKIIEAAKRRLLEETGLCADFEHWGDFRAIRKTETGEMFEDIIFCICVAKDPSGELIADNQYGENWWDKFDKIYEYLDQDIAIASVEKTMIKNIQKGLKNNKPMQEEVVVLKKF